MSEVTWFVYKNGDRYSVELFEYVSLSRRLIEDKEYIEKAMIVLFGEINKQFPLTMMMLNKQ
jgi:hypothetical protein